MPGWQYDRNAELPPDWRTRIRPAALAAAGGRCQCADTHRSPQHQHHPAGVRCAAPATDVDHTGDRDDHSADNLEAVCRDCHIDRTVRRRLELRGRAVRPVTKHPGLR